MCGDLIVVERDAGQVIRLSLDFSKQNVTGSKSVLQSGLNYPSSLAFADGWIYVGEKDKITRFHLANNINGVRQLIIGNLPDTGNHTTKTVLIHNGYLYVSIGSSCNSCLERDQRRATLLRFRLNAQNGEIYATGLRNSVGLAINPWTQDIWATTNGRDFLNDNQPNDTVDIIRQHGDYGWPRCHAGNVPDPELGDSSSCQGIIQPVIRIQAHAAPLGICFLDATKPESPIGFKSGVYIALHGSWNRSTSVGHNIIFFPINQMGEISGPQEVIVQFSTQVRPVGLAFGPCGLYITDDLDGKIYLLAGRAPPPF